MIWSNHLDFVYRSVPGDVSFRKMTFIFHILIPKYAWRWTEQCHLHARFNIDEWSKSRGDFRFIKYVVASTYNFVKGIGFPPSLSLPDAVNYVYAVVHMLFGELAGIRYPTIQPSKFFPYLEAK